MTFTQHIIQAETNKYLLDWLISPLLYSIPVWYFQYFFVLCVPNSQKVHQKDINVTIENRAKLLIAMFCIFTWLMTDYQNCHQLTCHLNSAI